MEPVLKLGCDLHEVVVIKFNIFTALIDCPNIDLPIRQAKIIGSSAVEISPDAKGLQYEGSFEACADMYDSVF